MSNYLSIDLDYWANFNNDTGSKKMISFLNKVIDLDVPIDVVAYHDEMAKHINRINMDIDKVINVDTHSDMVDREYFHDFGKKLDEACWANYIKGKRYKEFIWYHPDAECYEIRDEDDLYDGRGRCDRNNNPFSKKSMEICGWGKCRHRTGLPKMHEMEEVISAGICISPNWSDMLQVDNVMYFLLDNELITKRFRNKIMDELKTCKFKYSGDNGIGRNF